MTALDLLALAAAELLVLLWAVALDALGRLWRDTRKPIRPVR
jgi:hypothetical protein